MRKIKQPEAGSYIPEKTADFEPTAMHDVGGGSDVRSLIRPPLSSSQLFDKPFPYKPNCA